MAERAKRPNLCDNCKSDIALLDGKYFEYHSYQSYNGSLYPRLAHCRHFSHCPLCRLVCSFDVYEKWDEATQSMIFSTLSGMNRVQADAKARSTHRPPLAEGWLHKSGLNILPEDTDVAAYEGVLETLAHGNARHVYQKQINPKQIISWLDNCYDLHPECNVAATPLLYPGISHLPLFRLIDVHNNCVVIRPVTERYLALSYVWGDVSNLKLTKDTKAELMSSGGLSRSKAKIPTTICDAIRICQLVGQEYLWVDSLCLMQDDGPDLPAGIKAMASIYENAYLTIIAGSGLDANSVLPGVRTGSRTGTQAVGEIIPGVRMVATTELAIHLSRSRYATRGWNETFSTFANLKA